MVDLFPHAGADQGLKLILKFIKRGMGVKLGIARGELREQAGDKGFVHAGILQQTEDSVRVPDAPLGQRRQPVGRKNGLIFWAQL